MPFNGTRQDVSNVVVDAIERIEGKSIGEATIFGQDIIVDSLARRHYAKPIIDDFGVRFPGCTLSKFGEDDCASAKRVKDIVDAVWKEVNPN